MDLSVDREPGPGPAQGLSHMFFTPQPGEDKGDDLATVLWSFSKALAHMAGA